MKIAFQLAYRNLIGAGLRTGLNVGVLAFSFIIILFLNSLLDGWNIQAKKDSVDWEYGQGQVIHKDFDLLDPFTIQDAHAEYSTAEIKGLCPVLIRSAAFYPQNRMISILVKGIEPTQSAVKMPTAILGTSDADIPAIISSNMAKSAKLKKGDEVLLRWRDKNGTFDASNVTIVEIFETNVPTISKGQIWVPIKRLQEMTGLDNHATLLVADKTYKNTLTSENWIFKSQERLLKNITDIIEMKKSSSSIMYFFLLGIAFLALFDTQVLSIFRRQKEIGTYIALGMTPFQVVKLFTVEGSMYSIFAMVLGSVIGIPLLLYLSYVGIPIPTADASQDFGVAMADILYPALSLKLVLGSILLMVVSATIVSFLPARKIAKMNPVDAIKGKLQ